jgi:hypothetical protein
VLEDVRRYGQGRGEGFVVVGRVVHAVIEDSSLGPDGVPDLRPIDSATRGDAMRWYRLGETDALERPRWSDPQL